MYGLLTTLGCVASQPEKDKQKREKRKLENIQRILDNLKISTADGKEVTYNKLEDEKDTTVDDKSKEAKEVEKAAVMALNDMKTYVTVVNGTAKKKFLFKDTVKVVNGQVYKCKNGYNEQNILIYNRSIWIGRASTPTEPDNSNEEILITAACGI